MTTMERPVFNPGKPLPKAPDDKPMFVPGERKIFNPHAEKPAPQSGLVTTWSMSGLKQFESCAYAVFLRRVKKIPEERSEAADRGTRIHDLAEEYVRGNIDEMPTELAKFEDHFLDLYELFELGKVICEEDWGFNTNWEPTGWMANDVWARMKLDAMVFEDDTSAKVIDYKTGRKFGNEIQHNGQAMGYAIGAFMKYPKLEYIETSFWYLDKGEKLENSYTRANAMALRPRLEARALRLTTAVDFPPSPGPDACRFCSFRKNGACQYAYQDLAL